MLGFRVLTDLKITSFKTYQIWVILIELCQDWVLVRSCSKTTKFQSTKKKWWGN